MSLSGLVLLFSFRNPSLSPNLPTTNQTETQLTFNNGTVKVFPGQTGNILLVDGESRILFGNSGSENSVPDIVFGKNYSLNDIHNINYLPIRKEISFYNNGYFITLKNLGCNKEKRFTDIPEIWVTDCSVNITNTKTEAPVFEVRPHTIDINTKSNFSSAIGNDPFIYGVIPRLSLMHWTTGQIKGKVGLQSGSMTSYSIETPWNVRLVTAYGIDTIPYTAEEIFNKQGKKITIGPLQVESKIKSFNCRVIYKGVDGGETQQCDEIIVSLIFSGTGGVVKLNSYSE